MSYRSQAVASGVLGTSLSVTIAALYAEYGPGDPASRFITAVFMLAPIWCGLLMWGLKQTSPCRAWIGLGILLLVTLILLITKCIVEGVA